MHEMKNIANLPPMLVSVIQSVSHAVFLGFGAKTAERSEVLFGPVCTVKTLGTQGTLR